MVKKEKHLSGAQMFYQMLFFIIHRIRPQDPFSISLVTKHINTPYIFNNK